MAAVTNIDSVCNCSMFVQLISMGESGSRKHKPFWRVLIVLAVVLFIVLFVLFFVNWRFISSDVIGLHGQRTVFFSSESSDTLVPVSPKSILRKPFADLNSETTGTNNFQLYKNNQDGIKATSMENVRTRTEDETVNFSDSKTSWSNNVAMINDRERTWNDNIIPQRDSSAMSEHTLLRDRQTGTKADTSVGESVLMKTENSESDSEGGSRDASCINTPLAEQVARSSYLKITDFDCSESNEGWEQHIPKPISNSSRSIRMSQDRLRLLKQFSYQQDNFNYQDDIGKYIVFYPIFAGIGNNLAVFAEVLLIALRSNRKFLVYDWDALRDYFYLPFQYEVIKEKGTHNIFY